MQCSKGTDTVGGGTVVAPGVTVVAGLRWDPIARDQGGVETVDLDMSCVLLGVGGSVIEVVGPRRTRASGDSVVHTGDSATGLGAWDDERVFVFASSLPPEVAAVAFVVTSIGAHGLGSIPGAVFHVGDGADDADWLSVGLERLGDARASCVGALLRRGEDWLLCADLPDASAGERAVAVVDHFSGGSADGAG